MSFPAVQSAARRLVFAIFAVLPVLAVADGQVRPLPDPQTGTAKGEASPQTVVFTGGCFWGVQAVFQQLKGVVSATTGYAGGALKSPSYAQVGMGNTGHAESVQVVFDPAQISYGQLLKVFFAVAHDPTELNRQGPDSGTQYRSAVFATTAEQQRVAASYVRQLETAQIFRSPIVTEVSRLSAFHPAEAYHQNYVARHPDSLYVRINDLPKLAHLQETFPQLIKTADKP